MGTNLGNCLLDRSLKSLGVGSDDLLKLFAILEDSKGGHGADAEFLGNLGRLVDVELEEFGGTVLARHGHLVDVRGDHLARSAPVAR